jgi:hypothetical protein
MVKTITEEDTRYPYRILLLSDTEFEKKTTEKGVVDDKEQSITKEDYYKLPAWKQVEIRRKLDLF